MITKYNKYDFFFSSHSCKYPFDKCYGSILAALHFNHNLRRENKLDQNGQHRLRVTYMKYKEGEETVRHLREKQDFSMLLIFYYSNLFSWLLKLLPCNHTLYLILSSLWSRYLLSTGHNPQEGIRDDRKGIEGRKPRFSAFDDVSKTT